jgi:hypothetical protein
LDGERPATVLSSTSTALFPPFFEYTPGLILKKTGADIPDKFKASAASCKVPKSGLFPPIVYEPAKGCEKRDDVQKHKTMSIIMILNGKILIKFFI